MFSEQQHTDTRATRREDVRRALAARLLREQPLALLAYAILAAATVAFLWTEDRAPRLGGWALALALSIVARVLGLRHWARRGLPLAALAWRLRVLMAIGAVAWGAGAAALFPEIQAREWALVLVVLAGLVAGATVTLEADPIAFRLFLVAALGPLPIGILAHGHERAHIFATFLILCFAAFMLVLNARVHRTLVRQLTATVRLEHGERQEHRQRAFLDALFASAPVAIAIVDPDGRVRATNPRFAELFGYPQDEAAGRPLDDLIVPAPQRDAAARFTARAVAGEFVEAEAQRHRKDGSPVAVRFSARRVEGFGDGTTIVLYEDITERKRVEQAMREARELAERTARSRSAFLANMSHEIRTPMNAVLGMVELVLDTDVTTEQRRALELVRSSAEALLAVLNDILDFSKIEAEHLELETIPFDLHKLVHSTVSLLAVRARSKHLELIADVAGDVPAAVRGDPTRLRQILTNLIGNAIKFTEEGEVAVTAAAAGSRDRATLIRFTVRDTGIGIAPQQLQTIFQEFQQADVSMTRRYGGTGLGLAISRRLVALMGGELSVRSELGRGSEFAFTVPLPVAADAAAGALLPEHILPGSRRVLVVDDNETNRRILRDMLAAEGMVVAEATGADAALDMLRRAHGNGSAFDLAIIDAQMPDRDGFALAAAVRADPALGSTRFCMLTSSGERGDGERCRQLGIRGYLTKPIARADLLEAVGMVLSDAPPAGDPAGVVTRHTIREARRELHILLAEDNVVNQQVAVAMLVRRGHQVDVAANGREAVDLVRQHHYDVVLMDIQMPEMDGFEATTAIRALPGGRDLPIYALTAHAVSGERERCLARGMTGYLAKPFRGSELYGLVESGPAGAAPAEQEEDAAVDLEGFRAMMRESGAVDAVDGILDTFLQDADGRLAALAAAVAGGDADGIAKTAHGFKSAAGTIYARGLATLLQQVEAAARRGAIAEARAGLERVRAAAAAVVDSIRAARAGG
jgi:two-component system sensor histidine kinase/response regulator